MLRRLHIKNVALIHSDVVFAAVIEFSAYYKRIVLVQSHFDHFVFLTVRHFEYAFHITEKNTQNICISKRK